jgi:hypothetical protein
MTPPADMARATLVEYDDQFRDEKPGGKRVEVQFNPESLKLSFANQVAAPKNAGDQRGPSTKQFVGAGTTKLSLSLWFDVTAPPHEHVRDVRELTRKVGYFITPAEVEGAAGGADGNDKVFRPPPIGFGWGTFLFTGIMDSLEESLDLWSSDGRPLRASVALALTKQSISGSLARKGGGAPQSPGTRPLAAAGTGATLQGMADLAGRGASWQAIASANGIENPRQLTPGLLVDLHAGIGISAGASAGAGLQVSAGAEFRA